MKRTATCFFLLLACLALPALSRAQMFCDTTSNIAIYSNYDGGPLTINVDQNIPNLKIGIVSYEYCTITITGTYAANVAQVWWAGYNGTNNHCNGTPPYTTTITGVAANVDTMEVIPPATMSDPNGYSYIICAYQCASGNQGGCNTPEQVAHYFMTKFGGGTIRFHYTQYGCWSGTKNISAGGNCCMLPLGTGLTETAQLEAMKLYPNPATSELNIALNLSKGQDVQATLVDVLGREVAHKTFEATAGDNQLKLPVETIAAGLYVLQVETAAGRVTRKIEVR